VLGVLAAALLAPPVRSAARNWRAPLTAVASGLAAIVVAVAPTAFALPYPVVVSVQVALTAVAAAGAVRTRDPRWAAVFGVVAGGAALEAAGHAAGDRTAALIVLPILAALAAAVALRAPGTALRLCALGAAAAYAGLEAVAVALTAGITIPVAASVGFAVTGTLLLIASLRPGQARAALLRHTGTALLLWATWLRLWAADVEVVEAYTVPLSLILVGYGWWRRRRSANPSSWVAYGPGLSSTMLPSLIAGYADPDWRRSLALGVAALAVLLAGARHRLQAPTLIGGVVLAGVAVHELAPYVAELLLAIPRWVPIAVGGLLLVIVGATYEARLRNLRALRDKLAKMT
jgi:hypothetical protein